MRKYYSGITVFKLVGSVLVMFSHVKLPGYYLSLTKQVTGLGALMAFTVPCFYLISGFLACKAWTSTARPGRYSRRYRLWIGAVYGLFFLNYVARVTLPLLQAGYPVRAALKPFFEVIFVSGPSPELWFIPPLLAGVAAAYWCERRGRLGRGLQLAALGFGLAQLGHGTLRTLAQPWVGDWWVYHFRHAPLLADFLAAYLGIGVPAVLLGAWIARHEARFLALPGRRLAWLAGLGAVAEIGLLNYLAGGPANQRLVLSMAPVSVLLFYGVLHIQAPGIRRYHALINCFSVVAYFLHVPLLALNAWLLGGQLWQFTDAQSLLYLPLMALQVVLLTALLHGYLEWRARRRGAITAESPG